MTDLRERLEHIALFNVLWAVAHIAHVLRKEPLGEPSVWLLVLTCVLVIQQPTSAGRLALLALSQIVLFARNMPGTDNHMYIMFFANAGILAVAAVVYLRTGAWRETDLRSLTTYLFLTLTFSYAAAAVSKLNHDFFASDGSCAVEMFYDATRAAFLPPGWAPALLERLLPFAVAGAELAIPLLLVFRRTRLLGIALLVLFHMAISLSPTATALDFTLLLFAFSYLLLPVSSTRRARRTAHAVLRRLPVSAAQMDRVGPLLLLFCVLAASRFWRPATLAGNRNWMILAAAAIPIAVFLLLEVVRNVRARGAPTERVISLRSLRPLHLPLLALLLFNAATPYLGIKTVGTFTMYSNLNTFDGSSNHFFLPRLPGETLHDDLVEIVSTSHPALEQIRSQEQRVTWVQLRQYLARAPDASVSFIRDGELYEYARADENPELVELPPLLRLFVVHREHDPEHRRCLW